MHPQSHRSDPRILGRRTLDQDHRCLAGLLRPGLSVLDIGCGTGAITVGIAQAVGPDGLVLGLDRDPGLLEIARRECEGAANLRFESGDATELTFRRQFDIVTAARTLQWISSPERAVSKMAHATRAGGLVVVLDYNHARNAWKPEPPAAFRTFYAAFLVWRAANGWDNEMADHLPELFRSAGLLAVENQVQDETTERGGAGFAERARLWPEVIESLGEALVQARFLSPEELQAAQECCEAWIGVQLEKQTLSMQAVIGRIGK